MQPVVRWTPCEADLARELRLLTREAGGSKVAVTRLQANASVTDTSSCASVMPLVVTVKPPNRCSDFNGDGEVSVMDFFLFAGAFGKLPTGVNARFDLDGDGLIEFSDFFIFADAFGHACVKQ